MIVVTASTHNTSERKLALRMIGTNPHHFPKRPVLVGLVAQKSLPRTTAAQLGGQKTPSNVVGVPPRRPSLLLGTPQLVQMTTTLCLVLCLRVLQTKPARIGMYSVFVQVVPYTEPRARLDCLTTPGRQKSPLSTALPLLTQWRVSKSCHVQGKPA